MRRGCTRTSRVPGGEDDAAVHGIILDGVNDLLQLVNALSSVVGVHVDVFGAKVPPLEAIHGPQITRLAMRQTAAVQKLAGGVAVPYVDAPLLQVLGVGVAPDEPDQFLHHAAEKDSLRRQQRILAIGEGEAHLGAKDG